MEYDPEFWIRLPRAMLGTIAYGVVGILLTMLGFKVFDWITPKIDIQRELAEKNNLAVAIVCAAVILGICYVVASSVSGG